MFKVGNTYKHINKDLYHNAVWVCTQILIPDVLWEMRIIDTNHSRFAHSADYLKKYIPLYNKKMHLPEWF